MIEYIEQQHQYVVDGILVPSVTRLVEYALKEDFSAIPKSVLNYAATFGTHIHEAIERDLRGICPTLSNYKEYLTFDAWRRCKREITGNLDLIEAMVAYQDLYAGRIDLFSDGVLYDWKTNSQAPIDHLRWQLGYYKLALEFMGYPVKRCRCLWLRKGLSARWIEIDPVDPDRLLENYQSYRAEKKRLENEKEEKWKQK